MGDKCGKGLWQQGRTHGGNLVRCHAVCVAGESPSSRVGQVITIQLQRGHGRKMGGQLFCGLAGPLQGTVREPEPLQALSPLPVKSCSSAAPSWAQSVVPLAGGGLCCPVKSESWQKGTGSAGVEGPPLHGNGLVDQCNPALCNHPGALVKWEAFLPVLPSWSSRCSFLSRGGYSG